MPSHASFNAYLSSQVYQNIVPVSHFLRQLNELIDWRAICYDLFRLANNDNGKGGRPRYSPIMLFKMLFLSFLYDMSDRDTSELCTGNLACKYFIGMDIAKQAPDFTTLCVFRNEVLSKFGTDWVEGVFSELVRECQKRGVVFGSIYALDSTHTLSKVNAQKEKERDQRGLDKQDPDAAWGVKGTEKRLTPDNQEVEVVRYFHGYKSHLIAETLNGLVTNLKVTPGNEADINAGDDLLNREMTKEELERIEIITADKAYGDGAFIRILEKDKKIKTAISLSKTFFKGKHKARWQEYTDDPERATARKQRYVIERTNADLKNNHTLGRCRYLGLTKYHFQSIMSCIAHNLKIMTTAITGARLRPI